MPKRLAMKHFEKISFASIGIIKVISVITAPFVKFLTFSTNIVSKIFGVTENDESTVTEEEIRMLQEFLTKNNLSANDLLKQLQTA